MKLYIWLAAFFLLIAPTTSLAQGETEMEPEQGGITQVEPDPDVGAETEMEPELPDETEIESPKYRSRPARVGEYWIEKGKRHHNRPWCKKVTEDVAIETREVQGEFQIDYVDKKACRREEVYRSRRPTPKAVERALVYNYRQMGLTIGEVRRALAPELRDIKNRLDKLEGRVDKLEDSREFLKKGQEELRAELVETQKKVGELQKGLEQKQDRPLVPADDGEDSPHSDRTWLSYFTWWLALNIALAIIIGGLATLGVRRGRPRDATYRAAGILILAIFLISFLVIVWPGHSVPGGWPRW